MAGAPCPLSANSGHRLCHRTAELPLRCASSFWQCGSYYIVCSQGTTNSERSPTIEPIWDSPDGEQTDQRERHRDKAEIEPGAIALGVIGPLKQLEDEPNAQRKTETEPQQIGRRFVGGPDGFALRQADADRQHQQENEEDG